MISVKFYQQFLPKYIFILVSQARKNTPALNLHLKVFTKLHDSSCKNTKFLSISGGTSVT